MIITQKGKKITWMELFKAIFFGTQKSPKILLSLQLSKGRLEGGGSQLLDDKQQDYREWLQAELGGV